MDRTGQRIFFLYLLMLIGLLAGLGLAKGGLYVDRHEGDTLHLIEIILRMGRGEWPHLDFMTPIGVLSFLPMALFVWAGFGVGTAILLGQILFALITVPLIWWVGVSRLPKFMSFIFGAVLIAMIMAMVHGESDASISLSMHYNRWAWALAFVSVPIALLPAKHLNSQVADGVVLGLAMGFFVLGKVTFAVALAPGLVVALIVRKQWIGLAAGVGVVALIMLAALILGGPEFWVAYIGDLLQVSKSEVRPRAGLSLAQLLLSPLYLVANLILVGAIVILRKGEDPLIGALLILLFPGFIFITYQNWGNDPKWLAILALVLWMVSTSQATRMLSVISAILIAPSFVNMAISPAVHLLLRPAEFAPVFARAPHDDFLTLTTRASPLQVRQPAKFEAPEFASLNRKGGALDAAVLRGQELPLCIQVLGLVGFMQAIADDLKNNGFAQGKTIFTTDTFGSFWMFNDLEPLPGGAPWYYGDLSGIENADYILMPLCAVTPRTSRIIINELNARDDIKLDELRRTELYILYAKS